MLDAMPKCETRFNLSFKDRTIEYAPNFIDLPPRIRCDRIVIIDSLRKTCDDLVGQSDFIKMDIDHQVRRSSGGTVEQFTFLDVCRRKLRLGFLWGITQSG